MVRWELTSCLLLTFLAGLAVSDPVTKFIDCGSKVGKIVSLDVTPCPKVPCELKRGSDAKISITFVPSENSTRVKAIVHGVIKKIPVPFPLPDTNACDTMSPACPLKAGAQAVYSSTLPVKSSYPPMAVIVKWELADAATKDFVCLEVPARIV